MYAENSSWFSVDHPVSFSYNPNFFQQQLDPSRMLKSSLNNAQNSDQVCVPTHQLFDGCPPSPASPLSPHMAHFADTQPRLSISIKPPPPKRSVSPSLSPVATESAPQQKKRAIGERISTKDFVPPDVSGMSKREARLVKNRAAAFLSRQRKREEFEAMEIRVAELERENSRLLALTQQPNSAQQQLQPSADAPQQASDALANELESLKTQVGALREREAQLSDKLAQSSTQVKIEESSTFDASQLAASTPRPSSSCSSSSSSSQAQSKSTAALGFNLMVLLCALPTLFSLPSGQPTSVPTNFPIPTAIPTSPSGNIFEFNPFGMSDQYDWTRTAADAPSPSMSVSSLPTTKRLQFSNLPAPNGEMLDISFSATPTDSGKIRVTIHNTPESSVVSSRSTSPFTTSGLMKPESEPMEIYDHLTPPGLSYSDSSSSSGSSNGLASPSLSAASVFSTHSPNDPFLGIGSSSPSTEFSFSALNSYHDAVPSFQSYSTHSGLEGALNYDYSNKRHTEPQTSSSLDSTRQRRVRIALKSLPEAVGTGSAGGEWEVEFC